MTNRYADDIKRIVGIDPNQSVLGPSPTKSQILAGRGIAYISVRTGDAKSISGSPGLTQLPSDLGDGDLDTGENDSGEVGLNPFDLQNAITTEDSGVEDAADIIDGIADQSKISEPQTGPGGLEYSNDGGLNAITAVDCDTGDVIEIRTGGDYLTPRDWTSADDPTGSAEAWTQGTRWTMLNPNDGTQFGSAWYTTALDAAANFGDVAGGMATEAFLSVSAGSVNGFGQFTALYDENIISESLQTTYGLEYPVDTFAPCTIGVDDACPVNDPTNPVHPPDDKYTLLLEDGQFSPHTLDTDTPLKYESPVSFVDFCFGAGGSRTGVVEVTKDNGFMIYETSMGAPTGPIRAYDSAGRMIAAFDNDSGLIDAYRP